MASEDQIRNAIQRHIGKEVTLCDLEDVTFRDFLCSCVGSQCIGGLLMQLAAPKGNVDRENAGACGEFFYIPMCYPLVITDGCCVLAATDTLQSSDSEAVRAIGTVAETGIRIGIREKLQKRAGLDGGFSMNAVQVCCAPCFCVPCHNAALVREIRPAGYGGFWCPPPVETAYSFL